MSEENYAENLLNEFYRDYNAWLERDAPENDGVFSHGRGLCSNLHYWTRYKHIDDHTDLNELLYQQFIHAGLDDSYPFDNDGDDYSNDRKKHLNPLRIKWVKDHCKPLSAEDK